jgi:hypothetical protein
LDVVVKWAVATRCALELHEVARHLGASLPTHDEWHQHLPDPVSLEVDDDGEPGPLIREWLHGEINLGADRSVDAAHRPGAWSPLIVAVTRLQTLR